MTSALPSAPSVAELVRLPAVLSVPGDALAGAAWSGGRSGQRLVVSSALLYQAGMALNDYADRDRDARERPQRPIPSNRVTPGFALALAVGLTAAGVATAAALGGRRALGVAAALAATVWAYDMALKDTPGGPALMAGARSLDVVLGASRGRIRDAMPAAAVIGAHTMLITLVSRREVEGAGAGLPAGAVAGTAAVSLGAAAVSLRRLATAPRRRGSAIRRATVMTLVAAHAVTVGRAELAAVRRPTPANLQRVVGRGIGGLIPLQAALAASAGPLATALALAGIWPVARRLAARTPVT